MDRTQRVALEASCHQCEIYHGIPQGIILPSMLSNLYVKPLGQIIRSFGIGCHQYADDSQLYISLSKFPGHAVEVLNCCLAAMVNWLKVNILKLNPERTKVMQVGKVKVLVDIIYIKKVEIIVFISFSKREMEKGKDSKI